MTDCSLATHNSYVAGIGRLLRDLIFRSDKEREIRDLIIGKPPLQKCLTESRVWNKRIFPEWDNNWSPLHFAAHIGKESIVKLLVEEFGAFVNVKQSSGTWMGTPLHTAIKENHPTVVSTLLSYGADVYISGCDSTSFDSALHYAEVLSKNGQDKQEICLLYTSPSPRDS